MQVRGTLRDMQTTIMRLLVVVSLMLFGSPELRPASAATREIAAPLANAWQRVAQVGQVARSLAASPVDADMIYATVDHPSNGGVYRSYDGGRTWESSPLLANNGLSNREVQAVAVCPSGQVFAGTWGGGVYRADVATWTSVNGGIGEPYITALECDAQGRLFAGTITKGVFRSVNAGASWQGVNSGLTNQSILTIRSWGSRIFTGTMAGAFSSANGGDNWSSTGLQGHRVLDFEFDPTDIQRLWAASTDAGILVSSDGGVTWSSVGTLLEAYSVARDADGKLYAGTRGAGAYRLIGGQWAQQELGAARIYYLRAFGTPTPRVVAGTSDGIWIPPLPQLHLTLHSDPSGSVPGGSELTYYIDYWADGIGTVSNVVVTNAIPDGTVFVPGSITPAGHDSMVGGIVSWQLGKLDPDTDRGTLSYRVRTCVAIATEVSPSGGGSVNLPLPNCPGSGRYLPGVPISISASVNTGHSFRAWAATVGGVGNASLTTTTFTPGNADATLTAYFDVQTPHLSLTKAAVPTSYSQVGQVINYTLVATNDGNATLTGVGISDPMLASLSCTPAQPATLAPGEALSCTGSHTVTQADVDAGALSNTANAAGAGPLSQPVNAQPASATVTAGQTLHLALTKTAAPTSYSQVGQVIAYTLVATNDGNVTLTGVSISDAKLGTLSCDKAAPVTLAPSAKLTCSGSHTITQADLDAGALSNTANAAGTGPASQPVSALPASATVSAAQTPALTLSKQIGTSGSGVWSSSITVAGGSSVYYKFTINNTGNISLSPVSVSDPTVSTASCTWPASLAAGTSASCVVGAVIAATLAGTYTNTAKAHGGYGGSTYDSATSSAAYTVAPIYAINVAKSSTTTSITAADQVVPYTLLVTNVGNAALSGITVSDPKCTTTITGPAGDTNGDSKLQTTEAWTYTCSRTVTQIEMDAGGNLSNTVTADSTESAPDTDTKDIPITQNPALTLHKTADPTSYSQLEGIINYTLVASNDGNVTLTGVGISDPMFASLSCTPAQPATLAPSEALTCSGSHTVTQADLDALLIQNTAQGHALFGGTPVDSNADSGTVTATQNPALTLDKTSATATPNETLTATPTLAGTLGTPSAMPTEALTIRVIELSTETPPETLTPTPDNTPILTWTTEPPMPMDTPTSESVMLQPRELISPARQAQDSLLRAASMTFSPASAEPIINHGAYAKWQYAGVEYRAISNPVINGKRIFLPIIMKGVG